MVGVAQVVEPQVVALVVVGSSPITHPIKYKIRAVEPARIRFLLKKTEWLEFFHRSMSSEFCLLTSVICLLTSVI
jgi:hypothetical protein